MTGDVPVTVDFRRMDHAREWTDKAMTLRPWRADFFDAFVKEVMQLASGPCCRVLELGSGPGFLAELLLTSSAALAYVAVDFSASMHALARQRLGPLAGRVAFVERDLRHKRHAPALHAQARERLRPQGVYLVCDHFHGDGGMSNDQLYMTVDEQRLALLDAGFADVTQVLLKSGLVLHKGIRS